MILFSSYHYVRHKFREYPYHKADILDYIVPVKQIIQICGILALVIIFLLPDPFEGERFPFPDGVHIFDGLTRVNFATLTRSEIDDVNLILWPGEHEAFQVLVSKDGGIGSLILDGSIDTEFTPIHNPDNPDSGDDSPTISFPRMSAYLEHFVEITRTNIARGPLGEYPDALIPWPWLEEKDFSDAEYVVAYIEIATDADAAPGIYTCEITITEGDFLDAQPDFSVPFTFAILDIDVDTEPLPVAMGVSTSNLQRFITPLFCSESSCSPEQLAEDIYTGFAGQLDEAGVAPINFDILTHSQMTHIGGETYYSTERLDSAYSTWLADIPVKQFPFNIHDATGATGFVEGEMLSDEWKASAGKYIGAMAEHFRSMGWMDDAFCYVIDEPNTIERYRDVIEFGEFLHDIAPDLKYLVTEQPYRLPGQQDWPDLRGIVDIWCPQLGYYRTDECTEAQVAGNEVWVYPNQLDYRASVPEILSPTLNIGDEFLAPQILVVTIYSHGIDGLLYWDCIYWTHADPFAEPNPSGDSDREFFGNGDGYLFYPGDVVRQYYPGFINIPSPLPSLRWKNLVQGLEDYRLLVKAGVDPGEIPDSRKLLADTSGYARIINEIKADLLKQMEQ